MLPDLEFDRGTPLEVYAKCLPIERELEGAWYRNLMFCKWRYDDGMDNGEILDRWQDASDEKRKSWAPNCWQRFGSRLSRKDACKKVGDAIDDARLKLNPNVA